MLDILPGRDSPVIMILRGILWAQIGKNKNIFKKLVQTNLNFCNPAIYYTRSRTQGIFSAIFENLFFF